MEMRINSGSTSSNDGIKETAVIVKNGYKTYSKTNIVLKGLNMTVPDGVIYGLLGPSGCGKTTLLHCILGTSELDSGEIKVKAKEKSDIGFMPQEISLYKELSVMETMIYYGRIFDLDFYEIEKRTDELLAFLELPSKFRIIATLSGGQSRRVSFAVALLHDPQLLILDEPTVGVDPELCVSIWNKLVFMVENENKTVIVTTHYIEETRRAHIIGLMRNGKLLAEDSPSQLMSQYNSSNLEGVFLQLCQKENSMCTAFNDRRFENSNMAACSIPKTNSQVPCQRNIGWSKRILFALLTKNFYWMNRNKLIMLFLLLEPIVDCVLYSTCTGNDPTGLKLAVVNEEYPQVSHCDWLYTERCNFSAPLSCRFLNKLRGKNYDLVDYYDIETAKNAVKKNQAWGVIHFPRNYTAVMNERIMLRERADKTALTLSEAEIWLDMSNEYIAKQIQKDTQEECIEYLQDLFFHCGWSPKMAGLPIRMEKAVFGNNHPSFRHTATPSFISLFHFYSPMVFTVGACLNERMTGSLNRCLISGVTMFEIMISLVVIQFALMIFQSVSMILILFALFDNPLLYGNLVWILLLLLSTGASGMFYGFLVAIASNSDRTATIVSIGTSMGLYLLSGVIWPLEGMHWSLRSVSNISPITSSSKAFRALSVKDWPITNSTVYLGFLSNFVWSSVFILITCIVIKKNSGLGMK